MGMVKRMPPIENEKARVKDKREEGGLVVWL
jgi:hypothetical protein